MSGHSKWSTIKRAKGKTDAARSQVFTKIGREIAVAVKAGGPDPDSNSALRTVIAKAKAANMPNDNISRSIKKASGELGSINYESVVYEGYGTNGVAVIVETKIVPPATFATFSINSAARWALTAACRTFLIPRALFLSRRNPVWMTTK